MLGIQSIIPLPDRLFAVNHPISIPPQTVDKYILNNLDEIKFQQTMTDRVTRQMSSLSAKAALSRSTLSVCGPGKTQASETVGASDVTYEAPRYLPELIRGAASVTREWPPIQSIRSAELQGWIPRQSKIRSDDRLSSSSRDTNSALRTSGELIEAAVRAQLEKKLASEKSKPAKKGAKKAGSQKKVSATKKA